MRRFPVQVPYDPFSQTVHDNLYSVYRSLRDDFPVYHNENREFWALSHFNDVQAASRDWKTFSSAAGVELDGGNEMFGLREGSFIDLDPPRHDQLRNLVHKSFTPKAIKALESKIRTEAKALVEAFIERGSADFAKEFSSPLPVLAIAEMLGLPREDVPMLEEWARALVVRNSGDMQISKVALDAASTARNYFAELAVKRRKLPEEDLVSQIVVAETGGESLSDEEATGMLFLLFLASTETSAALLGNSLLVLAQHPNQRAKLTRDLTGLPAAIEELLRYESPVQNLARITSRNVELHGETIPKHARVLLLYGAANRDERVFDEPDRLDLERKIQRHLAFGEGIHHCIGAPLARLEAKVALQTLLARIPEYEVTDRVERLHTPTTRGVASLPVVF